MDLSVYGKRPARARPEEMPAKPAAPTTAHVRLNLAARQLLASLNGKFRLDLLLDYPHVLNRIGELWGQPRLMNRYFEDLLIDSRGGRQGFPLPVISELTRLRDYYQARVNPVKVTTDVWSTVPLR